MTTIAARERPETAATTAVPAGIPKKELLQLYEQMVLIRKFELSVQEHYREGKLPGFGHLYIGEEATAVGVCAHLRISDYITSTHRGHGHALAKGVPPRAVMAELAGKATGCCGGRGGSMHLYAPDVGLFGTNGLVGGGIPSAVGVALASTVQKTDRMAVAFFGDGAVNHGAFHESVNFAGAQDAPVVFVCENNLYATATPLRMATKNTDVAAKAAAYGIPGVAVDGNDVIAVWQAMNTAARRARAGEGPTLIEARTYRVVGHHEGDQLYGTYRTKEEVEQWKLKDPILSLRRRLLDDWKIATAEELAKIDAKIDGVVRDAAEFARNSPEPSPETVHERVFAEPSPAASPVAANGGMKTQNFLEAIRDAIAQEMRRDPFLMIMGEGIGERGGSFAHTKGLWQEFGARRVIDTPICELGFTGAAMGAAATGSRAIADLMFTDFLFEAASQIIEQASKLRYMSNGQVRVPLVIRSGAGEVKQAGPHHSGTYHPLWAHIPGLLVAMPSTPADAKGMMTAALRCDDPVIFMEHKSLFSMKGEVPQGEYVVPFGQANIVRAGTDITIATIGLLVHRCLEAAETLAKEGISCEVIDLRTLVPLDVKTVIESVHRTSRALVVDEGYSMCGLGGEISAVIMECAFDSLDAPVGRLHNVGAAAPFAPVLEKAASVTPDKIIAAVRAVMEGRPKAPRRPYAGSRSAKVGIDPAASGRISDTPAPAPVKGDSAAHADGPRIKRPQIEGAPINMPHGDLTISEAKIVKWLVAVGDAVKVGDPVVEMETDKATSEIEATEAGVLAEILVDEGETVPFGTRLGTIRA